MTNQGIQNQGADVKAKDTGGRKSSRGVPCTSRAYKKLCIFFKSAATNPLIKQ